MPGCWRIANSTTLGIRTVAGETLADGRTGKNGRHALIGKLRQSVFGRLAGYEDVNDADRLRHDPAIRWIVGGRAAQGCAASPSQMGRFETKWLAVEKNFAALIELSGQWIDRVHARRPPRDIVLDMDSGRAGRRAGKRVTGTGTRTASRKAGEAGEVHFALPSTPPC